MKKNACKCKEDNPKKTRCHRRERPD